MIRSPRRLPPRRLPLRPVALLGALLLAATSLTACASKSPSDDDGVHRSAVAVHPSTTGTAAAVGALFTDGTDHPHSCTATVVASRSGDVVMTAAHCVSGDAAGLTFVPGYDAGAEPFGSWRITGAYAAAGWREDRDEDDDVALLTVAPRVTAGRSASLQQTTGAVTLGSTAPTGTHITVTAYDDGIDDSPVRCTTAVRETDGHPTLECHGFVAGSSGAAWLLSKDGKAVAVGIIGGLHQGGCKEFRSYSPPFGAAVAATLATADTAAAADAAGGVEAASQLLPTPPDDGC